MQKYDYKNHILEHTDEAKIFSHYVSGFQGKPGSFINPLTPDEKHPSLSIYQHEAGKGLRFKAHNTGHEGDAFQLVAYLKGLDNKNQFVEVCKAIIHDMNLPPVETTSAARKSLWKVTPYPELQDDARAYFQQWEITPELLARYNVKQLQRHVGQKGQKFDYTELGWLAILYTAAGTEKIRYPNASKTGVPMVIEKGEKPYLFGWEQAPEGAGTLILCEGEKDVLALAAKGFFAVTVGGVNNAVTPAHLEMIKAKSSRVFICYDTDESGRLAAARIAKKTGFPVIELPDMPNGNDIADYFAAGHSAEDFAALVESARKGAGEKKKSAEIEPFTDGSRAGEQPAAVKIQDEKTPEGEEKKFTIFHQAEEYLAQHHKIRNNSIARELEILSRDGTPDKDGDTWEPLNENDLYIEMQKAGIKVSINNLNSILGSRTIPQHNPITEYFLSLPEWDGADHVGKLISYFDYPHPEQFARDLRKWLIRVVRGIFEPHKYNKQAFVLVHAQQNSGKTHFCRWLTPPPLSRYRSEEFSAEKDGKIALAENIFLMIDELASLNRTDANALKALFSSTQMKIRLPYGKRPVAIPRIASIIGSTNDRNFLRDDTGSVRFLCFEIEKIDWKYSQEMDINAIYAQVYALYQQGEEADMTADEIAENERRNAPLQLQTVEAERIHRYVTVAQKGEQGAEFMAAGDVMELMQRDSQHRMNKVNTGKALQAAGHKSVKGPGKVYGYWVKIIVRPA